MSDEKGKFKVIKVTEFKDLEVGSEIPESDLSLQDDSNKQIFQFEYIEGEEKPKEYYTIKTGCFSIVETNRGTQLDKFELRSRELLKSINNTSEIMSESDKFFSRVDIYHKLKVEPKRAVLLSSVPGVGKTAAINQICNDFLQEEGTCIIIWDTSAIRSSSVNNFFLKDSQFDDKVKKLIFVMEDVGGGSVDNYSGGPKGVDSSLLNLLDGIGSPFKGVPTFIIATTNNPETSVAALIDRPGRFDKVIQLSTPTVEECESLISFNKEKLDLGSELSEEDKEAAKLAAKGGFSIAHIEETIKRSLLDDITILEATKQLVEHKKKFANAFREIRKGIGIG